MDKPASQPSTVDEYIALFPPEVQAKLGKIRAAIHEVAPGVGERIAYRMPAFSLEGDIAYFAAFAKHIGFYPLPAALEAFREQLAPYKTAKGSVRFPLDKEPPYELIKDIVRFRMAEKAAGAAEKKTNR